MSVAVRDVDPLDELRDRANSEHRLAVAAATDLLQHAIAAGNALNEARELIPFGGWMKWVEREFEGSVSNANFYRRLALNAALVVNSGVRTLREAERYLVEHADVTTSTPRTGSIVRRRREEILKLRSEGKTVEEVGAIVGVSRATVYNLSRKDWQRFARRRHQTRKLANRALKREQRDKAAKKIGGDVAEAYSLIRRTAQTLEKAQATIGSRESREHLTRALNSLYRCEDEVARAIRVANDSGAKAR